MKLLLEKRGRFTVDVAVNGQLAVDVVKASMMVDPEIGEGHKHQYDFICMDFTMPVMVSPEEQRHCHNATNKTTHWPFVSFVFVVHHHLT